MMNDPFAGLKSSNAGFTSKHTTNNMSTSVDMMVHIPLGNDGIGGSASNSVSNETKQAKEEGKEDFHTEVGSRASSTDNERKPVEDEVARFKRERKERIRGLKLSQTIKEEEEARRRADEEAAKFRAEERKAGKTIQLLDGINTAGNQEQSEDESTGDEGKVEDHVAPETSPTNINTNEALQKEEEERMEAQAEAARQEARLAAEAEAARLEKEEEERVAGKTIKLLDGINTAGNQEQSEHESTGDEGKVEDHVAPETSPTQVNTKALQKEEEERMTSQAEAARQEARLAAEAETARLEKEEEERMAKQEARVAAEAEAAILQKEEEEERMAAQAEAARQEALLAAEAEAARLEKEEEERMTRQAEVVRLQKIAMEYKLKKRMEERVAAQTRAARLQKEQEDQAAQLASENKRNSARRPLSANSARRPLSAALKKYRDRHEQREDELRDIMQGISITNSTESDKSAVSYADTDSLVSHNRDLARGASLKWERLYLPFCFGLLTTEEEAPRTGPYQPHETIENGSMLQKIMTKVGSSSKEVLEQSTGNVIMKSQDPFVTAVKRDGTY